MYARLLWTVSASVGLAKLSERGGWTLLAQGYHVYMEYVRRQVGYTSSLDGTYRALHIPPASAAPVQRGIDQNDR